MKITFWTIGMYRQVDRDRDVISVLNPKKTAFQLMKTKLNFTSTSVFKFVYWVENSKGLLHLEALRRTTDK